MEASESGAIFLITCVVPRHTMFTLEMTPRVSLLPIITFTNASQLELLSTIKELTRPQLSN